MATKLFDKKYILVMENSDSAVMNGSGKDSKTDDIHGMSSPKKKLMNAKEQAAYFEREVRCYVNNSLLWI